jgi:hypothetical protein
MSRTAKHGSCTARTGVGYAALVLDRKLDGDKVAPAALHFGLALRILKKLAKVACACSAKDVPPASRGLDYDALVADAIRGSHKAYWSSKVEAVLRDNVPADAKGKEVAEGLLAAARDVLVKLALPLVQALVADLDECQSQLAAIVRAQLLAAVERPVSGTLALMSEADKAEIKTMTPQRLQEIAQTHVAPLAVLQHWRWFAGPVEDWRREAQDALEAVLDRHAGAAGVVLPALRRAGRGFVDGLSDEPAPVLGLVPTRTLLSLSAALAEYREHELAVTPKP